MSKRERDTMLFGGESFELEIKGVVKRAVSFHQKQKQWQCFHSFNWPSHHILLVVNAVRKLSRPFQRELTAGVSVQLSSHTSVDFNKIGCRLVRSEKLLRGLMLINDSCKLQKMVISMIGLLKKIKGKEKLNQRMICCTVLPSFLSPNLKEKKIQRLTFVGEKG